MARNIKLMYNSLVCEESKLRGDITIGAETVIHPHVTIIAEAGPIIIGDHCLIEEKTQIIHRLPFDQPRRDTTPVMIIGSYNTFEVDCIIESSKIGNDNLFESKCYVGPKVTVTDGCTVGAGCMLTGEQILPENIVITGSDCIRRDGFEAPPKQFNQLDALKKKLPNFHKIFKQSKKLEVFNIQ